MTNVSYKHDGPELSEYSINCISGTIIVNNGAKLHFMIKKTIATKIPQMNEEKLNLDITNMILENQLLLNTVNYNFSNIKERFIPLSVAKHLSTIDVHATFMEQNLICSQHRIRYLWLLLFLTQRVSDSLLCSH